ncbi:hypothetical protein [Cylindrospermopsis raciborskii]|uniref:hypothetical protein n=1 Tax=Cylindrospermopsis raciborskii TaxID=77022 RepID=UPI0015E82D3F|nr:hypothetical protein [Cylindrospermopsis raciborskii]
MPGLLLHNRSFHVLWSERFDFDSSDRLFLKTFTLMWNPTVNYGRFGFTSKTAIAYF